MKLDRCALKAFQVVDPTLWERGCDDYSTVGDKVGALMTVYRFRKNTEDTLLQQHPIEPHEVYRAAFLWAYLEWSGDGEVPRYD